MKLLFIDPKEIIPDYFSLGLKREGFLVEKTKNLQRGFWMASNNCFDLLVICLKKSREAEKLTAFLAGKCPGSLILVLTDYLSLEEKLEIFESGADDIIKSDCSYKELFLRVRVLAKRERKNQAKSPLLTLDDLTLCPSSYKVWRGNKELKLRRKEFDLLHFFLRNRDNVMSKPALLQNVWDSNADFLTNTLEVHILSLRKKVDSPYPKKRRLIQTIYGRGYRFGLTSSLFEGA